MTHALGFAEAWAAGTGQAAFAGRAVDLGSGGGLPGLALALCWPRSRWTLLDSHGRAATFLHEAADQLELTERVRVVLGRAEDHGRQPDARGQAELVVARGFGPPAVTAECAAPLLAVGGHLVVSEPPEPGDRWPAAGLALLGLEPGPLVNMGASYRVLVQAQPCPEAYPRRTGVPAKRPFF